MGGFFYIENKGENMTDIVVEDITNGSVVGDVWTGTGVFDKLLAAVNKNIELQYTLGRIKGTDYANVYLGGMQSVLQQSIEYVLREKLIAAQVDDIIKGIEIKDEQKKLTYTERVIKDKEAAVLGLDNVIKLREASRASGMYVYVPAYEEIV